MEKAAAAPHHRAGIRRKQQNLDPRLLSVGQIARGGVFLRPSAKPLLACARRRARRGEAPDGGGKEVPAPASWRRAVGRHRLLRHRRLVRREHHEWCQTTSRAFWTPRRFAASSATAARPTAFTAGMTRPYGERRRLCPPPVPPTRARPCRRSRSAGARRSRHGFDGSAPMKNVTLTC